MVAAAGAEALRAVERAVDDLRRGYPVVVADTTDPSGMQGAAPATAALALLPLDLADDAALAGFEAATGGRARLLLSARRAATLAMVGDRAAAGQAAVLVARPADAPLAHLLATADPLLDLTHPLLGPHRAVALGPHQPLADAGIALMKLARLLPAALACPLPPGEAVPRDWARVTPRAVQAYPAQQAERLAIVARARVPLLAAEPAEVVAFRAGDGGLEHLAIVIGDPPRSAPVLTRLHSECFTGDLLGSLKCDCGPQLQGALRAIGEAGSGVLLYLAQEGRGIGLINKLRAYTLQDQGYDTVDANLRLGFEIDERLFAPAVRMLALLGFGAVRLMTNNPDKVAALEAAGVRVTERVAHRFPSNDHNALYLAAKRSRTGHFL